MPQLFTALTPPPAMRIILLLIAIFLFNAAQAEPGADPLDSAYEAARMTYRAHRYEDAVRALEALLLTHPDCARCAHLLGKGYGRLAQRANWLSAMDLARKTCSGLELAVRLAPQNADYIEDLLRYYRAAPEFLGGGKDKARTMAQRLAALQANGAE